MFDLWLFERDIAQAGTKSGEEAGADITGLFATLINRAIDKMGGGDAPKDLVDILEKIINKTIGDIQNADKEKKEYYENKNKNKNKKD